MIKPKQKLNFKKVYDILLDRIKNGRYPKGSVFPSQRQISLDLGVNERTTKKALDILHKKGLLVKNGPRTSIVCRNLSKKSGTFLNRGVVIFSVYDTKFRGKGWSDELLKGIIDSCHLDEFHAILVNNKLMYKELVELCNADYYGFLIDELYDDKFTRDLSLLLSRFSEKVVAYGEYVWVKPFDRVNSDHSDGCYQLTKALINSGLKNIVIAYNFDYNKDKVFWYEDRIKGYEKAMQEAKIRIPQHLTYPEILIQDHESIEFSFQKKTNYYVGVFYDYFKKHFKPEVILVMSDGLVFPAAKACEILGVKPGREIEIVGYDNYWATVKEREFCNYIPPFTVDKCNDLIGHEMIKMLKEKREGKIHSGLHPVVKLIKPKLIKIREVFNDIIIRNKSS